MLPVPVAIAVTVQPVILHQRVKKRLPHPPQKTVTQMKAPPVHHLQPLPQALLRPLIQTQIPALPVAAALAQVAALRMNHRRRRRRNRIAPSTLD